MTPSINQTSHISHSLIESPSTPSGHTTVIQKVATKTLSQSPPIKKRRRRRRKKKLSESNSSSSISAVVSKSLLNKNNSSIEKLLFSQEFDINLTRGEINYLHQLANNIQLRIDLSIPDLIFIDIYQFIKNFNLGVQFKAANEKNFYNRIEDLKSNLLQLYCHLYFFGLKQGFSNLNFEKYLPYTIDNDFFLNLERLIKFINFINESFSQIKSALKKEFHFDTGRNRVLKKIRISKIQPLLNRCEDFITAMGLIHRLIKHPDTNNLLLNWNFAESNRIESGQENSTQTFHQIKNLSYFLHDLLQDNKVLTIGAGIAGLHINVGTLINMIDRYHSQNPTCSDALLLSNHFFDLKDFFSRLINTNLNCLEKAHSGLLTHAMWCRENNIETFAEKSQSDFIAQLLVQRMTLAIYFFLIGAICANFNDYNSKNNKNQIVIHPKSYNSLQNSTANIKNIYNNDAYLLLKTDVPHFLQDHQMINLVKKLHQQANDFQKLFKCIIEFDQLLDFNTELESLIFNTYPKIQWLVKPIIQNQDKTLTDICKTCHQLKLELQTLNLPYQNEPLTKNMVIMKRFIKINVLKPLYEMMYYFSFIYSLQHLFIESKDNKRSTDDAFINLLGDKKNLFFFVPKRLLSAFNSINACDALKNSKKPMHMNQHQNTPRKEEKSVALTSPPEQNSSRSIPSESHFEEHEAPQPTPTTQGQQRETPQHSTLNLLDDLIQTQESKEFSWNKNTKFRKVLRDLIAHDFELISQRGSHKKLKRGERIVILPFNNMIKRGTLQSIMKMANGQ